MDTFLQQSFSGVISGFAGGFVFGLIKWATGPLSLGSESAQIGFAAYLLFGAILGFIFVAVFGDMIEEMPEGAKYGAAYGLALWFLELFFLSPWLFGGSIQLSGAGLLGSVSGFLAYLIYGFTLGALYPILAEPVKIKLPHEDLPCD